MATFRLNGYTYDLFIRICKKTKKRRHEAIKWKSGLKCTWERISFEEYEKVCLQLNKINQQP